MNRSKREREREREKKILDIRFNIKACEFKDFSQSWKLKIFSPKSGIYFLFLNFLDLVNETHLSYKKINFVIVMVICLNLLE